MINGGTNSHVGDRTEDRGQVTVKKTVMETYTRRSCSSNPLLFGPSNPSPGEQAEMEYRNTDPNSR